MPSWERGLVDVRLVSVRENESQIKALYLEMYQNRLAEVWNKISIPR